ncbi:MAG TPA: hypothetical protein VG271_07150 [Beijerinckiaceae bacterium]|jgi:hypothetical protein|nr:hypothetical protein [Beijerinckiaceae bacterium]
MVSHCEFQLEIELFNGGFILTGSLAAQAFRRKIGAAKTIVGIRRLHERASRT